MIKSEKDEEIETFFCPSVGCSSTFDTETLLTQHKKSAHKPKKTCHNCGAKVVRLKKHLDKCLSKTRFNCFIENCSASFRTKRRLKEHTRTVHVDTIKCPRDECDVHLKPHELQKHIRNVHGDFRKECDNCGKSFVNVGEHRKACTNDGVKKFRCSIQNCKASFTLKHYLRLHVSTTHAVPAKCPLENCDVYVKPVGLKSHLKFVHGNVQEKCENCGKSFKDLRKHYERCIGDKTKKFNCELKDCGSSFRSLDGLKRHDTTVHGTRVKCPHKDCKSLKTPHRMRHHLKSIHKETRKLCRNCGALVNSLKQHYPLCVSDGVTKIFCTFEDCKAWFTTQQELNSHCVESHDDAEVKCLVEDHLLQNQ